MKKYISDIFVTILRSILPILEERFLSFLLPKIEQKMEELTKEKLIPLIHEKVDELQDKLEKK